MTTRPGRRSALFVASLAALLAWVVPASAQASTSIRTSTTVPGLAWASATLDTAPGGQDPASGPFASTSDRGITWVPARAGEVAGPNPLVRFAIGGPGLISSTDGGVSWHELSAFTSLLHGFGASEAQNVTGLAVDPARAGVVYAIVSVAYAKSSMVSVLESKDAGASWTFWKSELGRFGSHITYDAATPLPGRDALLVERVDTRPHVRSQLLVATPTGVRVVHELRVPGARGGDWTDRMAVDRSGTGVLLETNDRGWLVSRDGGAHVRALGVFYPAFDLSGEGRLFALRRNGALLHSADDGLHWQRRGRVAGASGLAVDRGGKLVYAYGDNGVSVSRDGGASFRALGAVVGSATIEAPPELASAGGVVVGSLPGGGASGVVDQAPHAGYLAAAPTGDAVVVVSGTSSDVRSADGSWQSEPITDAGGAPAIDPHGVAYLARIRGDAVPDAIQASILVSTHAPGGTWTPPVPVATTSLEVTGRPQIATDAAGDVLVTFIADDGVWATILRAGGPVWSAPAKVSGGDVVPQLDSLLVAGGGADTFVVAWDGAPATTPFSDSARASRIGASGGWSSPVDLFPLPGTGLDSVSDASLTVDSTGNGLILAPTSAGPESLTWTPGAASWTAGTPVAPPAGPGAANGAVAFTIGPDGTAIAVYTHADAHELVLRDSTSRTPYATWTPDATDVAVAEDCPAGDCLAAAATMVASARCDLLCVASGLPPVVASDTSHTALAAPIVEQAAFLRTH